MRIVSPFMIHIGKIIEEELRKQERSVSWFARKLVCDRSTVYAIFQRQSINTDVLLHICRILNVNFFTHYINELLECGDDATKVSVKSDNSD